MHGPVKAPSENGPTNQHSEVEGRNVETRKRDKILLLILLLFLPQTKLWCKMDRSTTTLKTSMLAATSALVVAVSVFRYSDWTLFSNSKDKYRRQLTSKLEFSTRLTRRSLNSLTNLVKAFGPSGSNAVGCSPGCMIASPSRPDSRPGGKNENENYYYQWPRDSGICLREVIRCLKKVECGQTIGSNQETGKELDIIIQDAVEMNLKLQHVDNPSGTFETGGLGEPKFMIDGSPFDADWGRPQNDGPALRSIALLSYATHILATRPNAMGYILDKLYSTSVNTRTVIRDDLDYLVRAWKKPTYELWEEVQADQDEGGHFHTLMVQRRALLSGANFASRPELHDHDSAKKYKEAASAINDHLERFWNPSGQLNLEGGPDDKVDWNDAKNLSQISKSLLHRPHVVGTLQRMNGQPKPCAVDTAVLLGFSHGYDGVLTDEGDEWSPWSDRCLVTLDRLVDVFQVVYPINKNRSSAEGVMCGRYPEDIYDGVVTSIGHPWFICTQAISEILYITAQHYKTTSHSINITPSTLSFWTKVHPKATIGTFERGQAQFEGLMKGLWQMADGYLAVCEEYVGKNDSMDEQIERSKGVMRGARELSWSYASFLSAYAAREANFMAI
jgi:glucoamylase